MHVIVRRPNLGHRVTTPEDRSGATNVEKTTSREDGSVNASWGGVFATVGLNGSAMVMTNPDWRVWTPHRAERFRPEQFADFRNEGTPSLFRILSPMAASFPVPVHECAAVETLRARSAVIDGEIVCPDPDGKPCFQMLQGYSPADEHKLFFYDSICCIWTVVTCCRCHSASASERFGKF